MKNKPARVRMAPSPTGRFHLGSARTALIDYLLAKQSGGHFILRIEDTDQKRYVQGAEEEFMQVMRWLGLDWDEGPDIGGPYGPYRQSLRKDIYQEYAKKLIHSGHAYYCFCSQERLSALRQEQQKLKQPHLYDGLCRSLSQEEAEQRIASGENPVIRFKSPKEGTTTVRDYSRGEITVENKTIDDFILVKSDGLALYHLAAMVDDHLMKITHVIRGAEWLATFPLHCLIYRAFEWDEPVWIHLSLFLKPSGKGKMSKRDAEAISKGGYSIFIEELMELGYLPQGVVNWIALMGWSYDDHTEFFEMGDLVEKFTIDRLNPSPSAINFSKLDHFNGLHIRNQSVEQLTKLIKPYFLRENLPVDEEKLLEITPIIRERIVTLDDSVRFAGFFFRDKINPEKNALIGKNMDENQTLQVLKRVCSELEKLGEMNSDVAEPIIRQLAEESGYKAGQVFGVMRIAITGQAVSPPLFESMQILGKETVIERINQAIQLFEEDQT